MKRILSFILIVTLVATTGLSVAFADSWKYDSRNNLPYGLVKKGFLPPGIAKKFKDIDDLIWAKDAIERMAEKGVIKGVGDGLFAPRNSVTKLEAVVMALRVMGEEEVAIDYREKIKSGKKKLKLKDRLQEWAYGYVALAEEKGILDEADILYFRLNEPAKRHEVAKYIIRALGYEDEAKEHMDADLDFKDASFVPQGSVGHIYIADKEGIITGYEDGTFRPLNTVTRAEMAVMIARLDNKFDDEIDDDDDEDEDEEDEIEVYKGEVTDIDDEFRWIEIEIEDEERIFDITDETEIAFEDDEDGDIEDIEIGDEVKVKVNDDNEIVYIEVDRELYKDYKGEVTDIDDDYEWIKVDIGSKEKYFDITDDTEIVFEDDDEGDIEDIEIGDEVKVKANDDNEIVYIEVDRELYDIYEGFVIEVDDDEISILSSKETITFEIDSHVEIEFIDRMGDLEDIMIGDEVKLTINEDDEVQKIEVDRKYNAEEITGKLMNVYEDERQISIKQNSKIKIYDYKYSVKVYVNDEEAELSDLEEDDNVLLRFDDSKVEEIRAYRVIVVD